MTRFGDLRVLANSTLAISLALDLCSQNHEAFVKSEMAYSRASNRIAHSASIESLQRVGFLVCVPALLRRFGLNAASVSKTVGLHAQALDDPEGTIPYQTMGKLVESAAQKTGCPHFGLEVGKQIHIPTLGLIGDLMRNAPLSGRRFRTLWRIITGTHMEESFTCLKTATGLLSGMQCASEAFQVTLSSAMELP